MKGRPASRPDLSSRAEIVKVAMTHQKKSKYNAVSSKPNMEKNKYLVTIYKKKTTFKFKTPLTFEKIINKFASEPKLYEADDNLIELRIERLLDPKDEFIKQEVSDVKFNGLPLANVPANYRTEEMCLAAVKKNGYDLQFVENQTEEICRRAIVNLADSFMYVKDQTEALILIALGLDGRTLAYVKDQTEEMCFIAVRQNGLAIQFVKEQTDKLCGEAIRQTVYASKYIRRFLFKEVKDE